MITIDNYYSVDIQMAYVTNSQIKDFFGCPAKKGCPAKALAKIRGEYVEEKTDALLIGGFVDAHFDGSLEYFKEKNSGYLFSSKKPFGLLAKFRVASELIGFLEKDPVFMEYVAGDKQTILQGDIEGIPFLGRLDVNADDFITDIKVIKDMNPVYCKPDGWMNFVDAWGYGDQLAIYQHLVFNETAVLKDCYLAVGTKEKTPDKEVVHIPNAYLEERMFGVLLKAAEVQRIKSGEKEAEHCGACDYCRSKKMLERPVSLYDLEPKTIKID